MYVNLMCIDYVMYVANYVLDVQDVLLHMHLQVIVCLNQYRGGLLMAR